MDALRFWSFAVLAFTLCFAVIAGQKAPPPLDQQCLGCICQAISDCNVNTRCDGSTCGLFKITWAYWSDAGKPTQPGVSPDAQEAYEGCVTEPYCAARAVQGYMQKFGKDCDGDGVITCQDYAVIHKLGGYACPGGTIQGVYANKFQQCLAQSG